MGRPYEHGHVSAFQPGPHAFAEALIPAVNNLFRAGGKLRAGAHHAFQISPQIGGFVAAAVGVPIAAIA